MENGETNEQKTGYITPATGAIVAANILVFAAMAVFTGAAAITGPSQETLLNFGADQGIRAMNGEYWRIVTNIFVHIGLLHCFMNMWIFAVMGPNVERIYGSFKFTVAYFFAGIIASLSSIYMHPHNISAGASGAVFGVFGLWFGFLVANRGMLQENFVKSNMKSAVVFLIMVLVNGFMQTGTDNAAHIGGVVAGYVCGFLISPNFPNQPKFRTKDFLGIAIMAALVVATYYLASAKTLTSTQTHSVALAPFDLKEPTLLLKKNKPQEAMLLLDKIVDKNPGHAQARYLRAHAYLMLNDDVKALEDIDVYLQKNQNAPSALLFKAERLIALSRLRDALKTADSLIAATPTNAVAYILRSSIYDRMDNTAKSMEDSNEAVRLAPSDANALSSRGYSYLNLGLTEDAIKDFTNAIKLDPNLVGAMTGRMFAYFMHADYIECDKQCVEILAKVGMRDRCAPYAVLMASICRKQLKQVPQRIAFLNQAIATLDPNTWPYPVVQYMAGQLTSDAVFQLAANKDKMTEAKTYIAFDLLADNKGAEASPMLLWVKDHGNKTFNEYDLVSALLLKTQQ